MAIKRPNSSCNLRENHQISYDEIFVDCRASYLVVVFIFIFFKTDFASAFKHKGVNAKWTFVLNFRRFYITVVSKLFMPFVDGVYFLFVFCPSGFWL